MAGRAIVPNMSDATSPNTAVEQNGTSVSQHSAQPQHQASPPTAEDAAPPQDTAPTENGSQPQKTPPPSQEPSEQDVLDELLKLAPQQLLAMAGQAWATHANAPTLVIWLRDEDMITRRTAERVFTALQPLASPVPHLWVILNSLGGVLHGAYHIARRLQAAADQVHVVIPRMAKSAATLITLGCHEVVMHPMAELGPIDTQTAVVRDDTIRQLSTLDALKSLEYLREYAVSSFTEVAESLAEMHSELTFKASSTIGASVMRGLVDPLFSRIDPIQVGEIFRALDVSREYGKRLVTHSYGKLSEDERERLVRTLAEDYPAHGFVIDLEEARLLGLNVRETTSKERGIVDFGVNFAEGRAQLVKLYQPAQRSTNSSNSST